MLRFQRDLLRQRSHAEDAAHALAEQARLEHVASIINALYDVRCGARRGSLPDPFELAANRAAAPRACPKESGSNLHGDTSNAYSDVHSEAVSLFQRLHGEESSPE